MANIKISLINESTVLGDDDVQSALQSLQTQVTDHFAPEWGIDADLGFVPKGSKPKPGSWWLTVFDNSDQPGALGYHDLTSDGLPLGKIFAGTDKQYGLSWTVTASHELLEMLGDPDINLTAFVEDENNHSGRLYAYEVCDACEADKFGYKVDGVLVSDFVTPAWFESFREPRKTKFDYRNLIKRPFQLLKGGYIGIYDVNKGTGWTQIEAEKAEDPDLETLAVGEEKNSTRRIVLSAKNPTFYQYMSRARLGSRREKRRTPRHLWLKSNTRNIKRKTI
jgi:hypothetical protein